MNLKMLSAEISVTGQIAASDMSELAKLGFCSIVNNRPDAEGDDQPESASLAAAAKAAGLDYYFLPFAPGPVPVEVSAEFASLYPQLKKPVLAFCRSGARAENLWVCTACPTSSD